MTRKLTLRETVAVSRCLDDHYSPEKGYAPEWSDQQVGETVLIDYPGNKTFAVLRVRTGIYGTHRKPTKANQLEDRVARLEASMVKLHRDLGVA